MGISKIDKNIYRLIKSVKRLLTQTPQINENKRQHELYKMYNIRHISKSRLSDDYYLL